MADLARFVEGYERDFDRAFGEIRGGRKRTHWMWYMFPQIAGLGLSPTAQHYAIADRDEAEAFLTDPRLGPAYTRLVDAVWDQVITNGIPLRKLFGRPDDQKLVSSLTLFATVATNVAPAAGYSTLIARANEILAAAATQALPRCTTTTAALTP